MKPLCCNEQAPWADFQICCKGDLNRFNTRFNDFPSNKFFFPESFATFVRMQLLWFEAYRDVTRSWQTIHFHVIVTVRKLSSRLSSAICIGSSGNVWSECKSRQSRVLLWNINTRWCSCPLKKAIVNLMLVLCMWYFHLSNISLWHKKEAVPKACKMRTVIAKYVRRFF